SAPPTPHAGPTRARPAGRCGPCTPAAKRVTRATNASAPGRNPRGCPPTSPGSLPMSQEKKIVCPDCEAADAGLDRRAFLRPAAAAGAAAQRIAISGKPGADKFEFVLTGRHLTVRADGNSTAHVALGGPIFHGHAATGFVEKVHHPGNVFWHQAEQANKVYQL